MAPLSWYSRWDGSQRLDDLDADQLLDAMSDDLLSDGDPWSALRRLFQRGAKNPNGANLPGLQDLLNRLRRQRQQQLDRYDLSSVLDDIKQKLDKILQTEREGIERRVSDAKERAERGEAPESYRQAMEQAAAEHEALDEMPESPGRAHPDRRTTSSDPRAHRMFWELMKGLQQQMLQPFLQHAEGARQHDPRTSSDAEMMRDLNRMLQDRAEGREPTSTLLQEVGRPLPGRPEPRPAHGADRPAGPDAVAAPSTSPGQRSQLRT